MVNVCMGASVTTLFGGINKIRYSSTIRPLLICIDVILL